MYTPKHTICCGCVTHMFIFCRFLGIFEECFSGQPLTNIWHFFNYQHQPIRLSACPLSVGSRTFIFTASGHLFWQWQHQYMHVCLSTISNREANAMILCHILSAFSNYLASFNEVVWYIFVKTQSESLNLLSHVLSLWLQTLES